MQGDRAAGKMEPEPEAAPGVTLDALPLEVLDHIVAALNVDDQRPRPRPPHALGRLAMVCHRLRLCCVDRADGVWQGLERAAFGEWLPPQQQAAAAAGNTAAHARYCVRMSCRVRVRAAVWALSKPPGLGSIPVRLPVNKGLTDRALRQRAAAVQLPCELIELYRAVDGQPVGTDGFQLIVPGFRLLSLEEIFAELTGVAVQDEPPSFVAGGWGGLGGDWAAALATDPGAGFIELPLTMPCGIQRYTVRFPRDAAAAGYPEAFDGDLKVRCSVRLRGMIGDGQEKSESLVGFFRGFAR